jgi:hypothetical protein
MREIKRRWRMEKRGEKGVEGLLIPHSHRAVLSNSRLAASCGCSPSAPRTLNAWFGRRIVVV